MVCLAFAPSLSAEQRPERHFAAVAVRVATTIRLLDLSPSCLVKTMEDVIFITALTKIIIYFYLYDFSFQLQILMGFWGFGVLGQMGQMG